MRGRIPAWGNAPGNKAPSSLALSRPTGDGLTGGKQRSDNGLSIVPRADPWHGSYAAPLQGKVHEVQITWGECPRLVCGAPLAQRTKGRENKPDARDRRSAGPVMGSVRRDTMSRDHM